MKKFLCVVLAVLCIIGAGCSKWENNADGGIPEGQEIYDVVPMIPVGGKDYMISPRVSKESSLPDGFEYAGTVEKGMYEGCEYYTNENEPYWIYVNALVDAADAEVPEYTYFRFVDEAIRGKDYVCVNGVLYVSGWSADYTVDARDNIFGDIRIEGDLPEGFESIGRAEFSGYDTVPEGELSSNTGSEEIFINENDDSVILVRTTWFTAPIDENGEVRHTGFNVYIIED